MAAYLVGHITVRDPDLWQVYTTGVKESLIPFDADVDKSLEAIIRIAAEEEAARP